MAVFCAGLSAPAETNAQIPAAFREVRTEGRSAISRRDPGLKRQRPAAVNMSLFDRNAAKAPRIDKPNSEARRAVRMNLFPEVDLVVTWRSAESIRDSGDIVWSGVVDGDPLSHATFVSSGGEVTGNIATGGSIYQVRPGDGGVHWIGELDSGALPQEGEPMRLPASPPSEPRTVAADVGPDDDGSLIDVMVAFTADARQAAGGSERMRQLIQLAVAETNQGYQNSGVKHRLRLVAFGEVNYRETGDFTADLDKLTSTTDGIMDEVHAARDRFGADLVSLWVEKGNYCGLAWILSNPSRPNPAMGFSVVRRDCATGALTFGHELGHNLGATHAPDDPTSQGAYPYSHGYKQMTQAPFFRSIMAYDCAGGCPRINYWSSPDVTYQGAVGGTRSLHDNRTTLNNTAAIVASYRRSTQEGSGTTPPPSNTLPESAHPYPDNFDQTWSYSLQGNHSALEVAFSRDTFVEEGWDYIVITDGNGREIPGSPFTGSQLSGKTVIVPGSAVRIRLVSDESVSFYGFKVNGIRAAIGGDIDLVTTSFTTSNTGSIGGTINGLIARVSNQGQAAAGAFRIAFYWITDKNEALFSGWSCNVESLGPGSTYTCSGDIGVSSKLTPGSYKLVAIADDQRQLRDVNWDNNARASEGGPVSLR